MSQSNIKQVGVVGGGTMGFGIAINFALWGGYPTIIQDLNDRALTQSKRLIESALNLFVDESLIRPDQATATLDKITLTTDLAQLATNSDFVTEAIVERLPDKQQLFNTLDQLCPPHTIIVSNTSGFVISDIGAGVKRQDKIGLTHYFAPPHIVPGVEVAKGPQTSDETYNTIYKLMKATHRIPIRVEKELPGYLINRIQAAMGRETHRLWAEGVATAEEIELGIKATFGFRMPHEGPMAHYDLAGIWKWPDDTRVPKKPDGQENPIAEKIRLRMAEGTPWFVDPEKFDQAIEVRDREYIRRLKELYSELTESS